MGSFSLFSCQEWRKDARSSFPAFSMFIFQYFSQEKRENEFFLYVQVGMYLAAEATGRLISVPTLENNQWSSHCFQWSCLSDITSRYLSEVVADLVIIINYFRSMLMIANIMFSNHVNAKNRFYVCCQSLHTIDTQSYDSIPIFHWVILLSAQCSILYMQR